ncbi:hypothetical protein [Okeania sp. KiyG1]|uniref:hypothetical protein n=1 Tax=Okeania sp. KiyG1 TaxID=2720165 RepID=UPI00192453F4|nr:hypothetical protein [Okeania sp. KiyG1]
MGSVGGVGGVGSKNLVYSSQKNVLFNIIWQKAEEKIWCCLSFQLLIFPYRIIKV